MGYWPRKRASRQYPKVRAWAASKDAKPLGFAGYKVGMTQARITDNSKHSITKGDEITIPVTVVEVPPMKVFSVRFYKKNERGYGPIVATEVVANCDKQLARKVSVPKKVKQSLDKLNPDDFSDITIITCTQPGLTSIGKKKPELFEVALGGSNQEKLAFAKENLGKEISVSQVLPEGSQVEIHSITRGKGYTGPIKRFGISIRSRKSEKTKRGPGSLGGWKGQGHFMYRVPHAGQMGYHTRTEYNKWIIKIGSDPAEINPKGGFINYGHVKSSYLLLKGSIPGPKKRLIRMNLSLRPNRIIPKDAPSIEYLSLESKQRR